MKIEYPAIITKNLYENCYVVFVPDFQCGTEGSSMNEAISMAQDAICLMGIDMQDDGERIPTPSDPDKIDVPSGSTVVLVEVDFSEYRKNLNL